MEIAAVVSANSMIAVVTGASGTSVSSPLPVVLGALWHRQPSADDASGTASDDASGTASDASGERLGPR